MDLDQLLEPYLEPSSTRSKRELRRELANYNLDDRVVERANDIYYQLSTSRNSEAPTVIIRANNRQLLIFYCIYHAYLELGVEVEPYTLAAELGFEPSVVKRAFKCFTSPVYGYRPEPRLFTVTELVIPIVRYLKLAQVYADIIYQMATFFDVELERRRIELKNPQRWALTLVYFCSIWSSQHLRITNDFNLDAACRLMDIRSSTIKSYTRQIERDETIHQHLRELIRRQLESYITTRS